jgi:hypothetical protein
MSVCSVYNCKLLVVTSRYLEVGVFVVGPSEHMSHHQNNGKNV